MFCESSLSALSNKFKIGSIGVLSQILDSPLGEKTCQDNFSPRNSPLIFFLPQTGTDFAQTSRTTFLTCW